MRTPIIFLFIFSALLSCNSLNNRDKTKTSYESLTIIGSEIPSNENKKGNSMPRDTTRNYIDNRLIINGVVGLLNCENVYDSIKIFNNDNSIFTRFTFKGEDTNEFYNYLDSIVEQFNIYFYKPDYAILIFPSNPKGNLFEIYLKNGNPKFIPKNDKIFKFYTWQEYLLSDAYLSIDDDALINSDHPIYEQKDTLSNTITFKRHENEIYFVKGIEIQENWLKVTCEYENGDKKYGWTKWYEKNKLLLRFYYLL